MNETSVTAPDAMEEELKGDSIETTHVETNEIEKCSTFGSTEDNQKVEFLNKRIAKQFRVSSSNKIHKSMGGKVNKIFFGTVDCTIPGKEEKWRILYDDGDVDIMLRINVIDAIRYYAINKHYDTKITTSTTPQKMKREEGRGGCNAANISTNVKHTKTIKAKSTPPKRGKKIKGKAGKTETAPVWTGPPDEELDGGWPEGVSTNSIFFSKLVKSFPFHCRLPKKISK